MSENKPFIIAAVRKRPDTPTPLLLQQQFKHTKQEMKKTVLPLLGFKRLHLNAILPTKGSQLAAGYDLYAHASTFIPAHGKGIVLSGWALQLPASNMYGRIAPRSGIAWKNHIDVGAGVIDSDYQGEVGILLFNHSDVVFEISAGDRIAQLIIETCYNDLVVQEIHDFTPLCPDSSRKTGGFGSTGQ